MYNFSVESPLPIPGHGDRGLHQVLHSVTLPLHTHIEIVCTADCSSIKTLSPDSPPSVMMMILNLYSAKYLSNQYFLHSALHFGYC